MGFLSVIGNSFGCSTSGERLLSAAREGDLEEAKALVEYNPRLARYSTFGVKNSPLHFSASHGHHEVIHLFLLCSMTGNLVKSSSTCQGAHLVIPPSDRLCSCRNWC